MLLYQILAYAIHGKIKNRHTKTISLKYHLQREMRNFSYQTDQILYQIFKIILSISSKKHEPVTDNPAIRIHVNKIENRVLSPTLNA